MASGSKVVVYAALAGNLAIALTKFAAAWWTGSSAMLSEGFHSTVDTTNQALLLLGLWRASRPPDEGHPFGHGMELYFWGFVVALMIFALGGAVSIYEGVQKLTEGGELKNAWVNFLVLGISAVLEGVTFTFAVREIRRQQPGHGLWTAARRSKDPSVFAVLVEDSAALTGIALAAAGVALTVLTGNAMFDGAASIAIGLVLMGAAAFLSRETLSLLTGEAASKQVVSDSRAVIDADDRVARVSEVLSMHLGPSDILLAVSIDFKDELDADAVEVAARDLTEALKNRHPEIHRVYLRPLRETDQPDGRRAAGAAPA